MCEFIDFAIQSKKKKLEIFFDRAQFDACQDRIYSFLFLIFEIDKYL